MKQGLRRHLSPRLLAIGASFLIGVLLMAAKFFAYWLTHSSAVLSDALESIINVVASAFALGSVIFSAKPPDACHPYGHGKIEYFSAGFEGALIILAAVGIFATGLDHILHPRKLPNLQNGLLILLGAGVINLLLGLVLVRTGRRTRSLALIADGKHILTDVYTSAGVVAGLFLVHRTGWYWLDGAVACAIGINILVSGFRLLRESFAGLMDASDPELLEEISELLDRHREQVWIDIHQLRAWKSGNRVHVDFHLILPRELHMEEAHAEVKKLERILADHFDGMVDVLIHVDPCTDEDCPVCSRHLCALREEKWRDHIPWSQETLTAASSHNTGNRGDQEESDHPANSESSGKPEEP
jgi:cation diffusion facilitator family transporter